MPTVGIDFGTSNSSIAIYTDREIQLFDLDLQNINPKVLPSIIYITRTYKDFVGTSAIKAYLEGETGRRVFWEKRNLGEIQITVSGPGGPIIYWDDLIVEIDTGARGRMLQSIKVALRDPKYEGTQVFTLFYSIEDLIGILMTSLKEKIEEHLGEEVNRAVIGRPVKFSDEVEVNRRAQEKLELAARKAGFKEVHFELEPIGGAYVYHQDLVDRQIVLVFDFGGGTLDMTIMEVGGNKPPNVLATQGVLIGGDDLTRVLIQPLLKYFGQGTTFKDGLPFPAHILGMLDSWQNMVDLSRPRYREIIEEAKLGSDPESIVRLETLITRKLGFKLYQELERVKIELSSQQQSVIRFEEENIQISHEITRQEFESLISQHIVAVNEGLNEIMQKSGLKDKQIQAVLRTGGSSAVPAFIELLAKRFDVDRMVELSLFTTIVGGMAIKAHELWPNG